MFSGVFIAEEVDEIGDKWLGNTKQLKYRLYRRHFFIISPPPPNDLPFSMAKFFSGKKQTSGLGTTLIKCWNIRIPKS